MSSTAPAALRVLHLVSGDTWGGAEEVLLQLVQHAYREHDIEVTAIVLNEGELVRRLRAIPIRTEVIAEDDRRLLDLWRELRHSELFRLADVVHVHRYKEAALAAAALRRRAQGLLFTVHGLQPIHQLALRDILTTWSGLLAARCAGGSFVAVSQELRRRLVPALGGKRLSWIPNPAWIATASPGQDDLRQLARLRGLRFVVGFVGRLEYVKGPDLFLEAARLCPEDVLFAVLGAGSMRQSLMERARLLGLEKRVLFLGHVPNAASCIAQFDVLAMSSRHEGLPMVAIEAGVQGTPLAAFAVGGVPELVDDSGGPRLVRSGDVRSLATAISDLLMDPEARPRAQRWGESLRRRLEPAAIARRYYDFYRMLARRVSPSPCGGD